MKTKVKLIGCIIVLSIIMMYIPTRSKAGLQANGESVKQDSINNWLLNVRQMESSGGTLGLTDSINQTNLTSSAETSNNLDIHMEKNTEYGAMAILSASSYGKPDKVNDGETTTGNKSGIYININKEWVAAGALTELSRYVNANPRYKNYYTNSYVAKYGDAIEETKGWHGSGASTWLIANGDYNGPSGYDINPIYDYTNNGKNNYYVNSCITGISTEKHNTEENIKFNILIPLYDLININKDSNTVKLVEDEKILVNDVEQNGIDLTYSDTGYVKNVPMGIWFSETPIELKRDTKTGYSPSWSLVLSSQFKPFPYSKKIPGEISQNNIKDGYATYAQILIRQNKLLDKLESVISQINDLHKRVDQIESKLNVGSSYSVDKMQTELINFENHITKNLNDFKDEVYSKLSNNWKGYIS